MESVVSSLTAFGPQSTREAKRDRRKKKANIRAPESKR